MNTEWLDDDGYPTNAALDKISAWPVEDTRGCIEFMMSLWWMPDWGINRIISIDERNVYMLDDDHEYVKLSTGGWSGNESLMSAFVEGTRPDGTFNVDAVLRAKSIVVRRRGGHYVLELGEVTREHSTGRV